MADHRRLPRTTKAKIARAIEAAREAGCPAVDLYGGAVRIIVTASPQDIPSPPAAAEDEAECDELFGTALH